MALALLTVALPRNPSSFPHLTCSKKGNHLLARRGGVPSLRRGCHLTVRCSTVELVRSDFPSDFKFGASTSALQTEGTATEGGRGPSTWDSFIGDTPAVDSYNKYKDDVKCLKNMSVDVYRFSISWSRILPEGTLTGGINQDGIDFYNNLINELIDNGVEPFVTLFHFDLPTALQTAYNGFLSSDIADDFKNYADLCFKNFGDRVKHWTTFNEPQVFGQYGYKTGMTGTDYPTKNPYIATHNIILSHASAAKVYNDTYKATQAGEIGMSLSAEWFIPVSGYPQDKDAAQRAWDFMTGWFLEPLVTGDYPFSMKSIVRDRLPTFTDEQQEMVKGSYDFIGVNYYTSRYAKSLTISANDVPSSYANDQYVETLTEKDGVPIGELAEGSSQIYIYPQGLADTLVHLKLTYNNPKIFITENGYPQLRDDTVSIETALQDDIRIETVRNHLASVKQALNKGVDVNGYFIWALMDCMEMGSAYTVRYGLNYTDYLNDYTRYAKKSATWLNSFLTSSS